jgi:hypothetical protein
MEQIIVIPVDKIIQFLIQILLHSVLSQVQLLLMALGDPSSTILFAKEKMYKNLQLGQVTELYRINRVAMRE